MRVTEQHTSSPGSAQGLGLLPGFDPVGHLVTVEADHGWRAPSREQCLAWWDEYAMPANIRRHSLLVADIAVALARLAQARGVPVDVTAVEASALLHDLAKAYTIEHGGNHAHLGGAWVQALVHHPLVAQGVTHHVFWPWPVDVRAHFLTMAVIYADKRVMHDVVVTLDERYEDLQERYGATPRLRERIAWTHQQVREIEEQFNRLLDVDIHARTFDSRGLVERT